ncbi:MAG: lysophospholipid acyltransferase family protein [Bacilli bacterium]|nr:lysophospholipid acyltransferase family protein [Bacilli bacterium]
MKDPIVYKIVRPLLALWFFPTYRPQIINNNIIPKKEKAVLAGNHVSKKDGFILGASTKRCIRFIAKDELTNGPARFFFKRLGLIPVNRRIHDGSVVPAAVEVLNKDLLIGVFPESTINKTSDIIMPFKTGAIRMAIISKSPIIPFAIPGEYTIFKKNVKIVFGELYYPKTNNIEKEIKILENKVIDLIKKYGE